MSVIVTKSLTAIRLAALAVIATIFFIPIFRRSAQPFTISRPSLMCGGGIVTLTL